MNKMTTIKEVLETIFEKLTAEGQVTMAIQTIKDASQYLDKEKHVEMAKWFVDSVADFP